MEQTVSGSEKWDESYTSGEGLRWWPEQELIRFIGKTYGATHGKKAIEGSPRALDLGCGNGRNSWLLIESGFGVNAVDNSREALRLCNQYLLEKGRYAYTDFECLPMLDHFAESMFDLVVDCHTIQHFTDKDHQLAYQEVCRVLKPGGRFWSMHWARGDAYRLYAGRYPELRRWYLDDLCRLGAKAGLTRAGFTSIERTEAVSPCNEVAAVWYCQTWEKP